MEPLFHSPPQSLNPSGHQPSFPPSSHLPKPQFNCPQSCYAPVQSFYFQNPPPSWDADSLKSVFSFYGNVLHTFISRKPNLRGSRYGFVKFSNVTDVKELQNKLGNVWIGTYKLLIQPARQPLARNHKYTNKPEQIPFYNQNPHRTFVNNNRNHPGRNSFARKLLTHMNLNSFPGTLPPYGPRSLKASSNEEDLNRLKRCAVGTLHDPSQFTNVEEQLRGMGVLNCSLTPMGGNLVLLEFPSVIDMRNFLEDENRDFGIIFDWISPWKTKDISRKRLVWIRCMGLPVHIWNEDVFRQIGNSIGNFIAVDESTGKRSRLDMARILVSTNILGFIKYFHFVQMEEESFQIEIVEDLAGDTLFIQSDFKVPNYGKNIPNPAWTTNLENSGSFSPKMTENSYDPNNSNFLAPATIHGEVARTGLGATDDTIQMAGRIFDSLDVTNRGYKATVDGVWANLSEGDLELLNVGATSNNTLEKEGHINSLRVGEIDRCEKEKSKLSSTERVANSISGNEIVTETDSRPIFQQKDNSRPSGPTDVKSNNPSHFDVTHDAREPITVVGRDTENENLIWVEGMNSPNAQRFNSSMDHDYVEDSLCLVEPQPRMRSKGRAKKCKNDRRSKKVHTWSRPPFKYIQLFNELQRLRKRKVKKISALGEVLSDYSASSNEACILQNNARILNELGVENHSDQESISSRAETAEAIRCWEVGNSLGFFKDCDKEVMVQVFKDKFRKNLEDLGEN